jgi:truncated hemoglobin YjbI
MERTLIEELARARTAAAQARALVEAAHRAGGSVAEAQRRRRELERLEDLGRSAVLECLELGAPELAVQAAQGLAGSLVDEAERAARSLVLGRRGGEARP